MSTLNSETNFKCDICRSEISKTIFSELSLGLDYGKHDFTLEDLKANYVVCQHCGTVSQYPLPEEDRLQRYYATSQGYLIANYKNDVYQHRVQMIKEVTSLSKGKALEIGSCKGVFLQMLHEELEIEVFGIEPSEDCCEYSEKVGIPVVKSLFENVDLENEKMVGEFDIVIAMCVLEHVKSPRAFLDKMARTVKEGGYLYIEVPSSELLSRFSTKCRFGENVNKIHLYHFTGQALAYLVNDLGFAVVHQSNSNDFDYPCLHIIARKISPSLLGEEVFLGQINIKKRKVKEIAERLMNTLQQNRNVVLWGASTELYDVICSYPELKVLTNYILVDRNPLKQGKKMLEIPIYSPEEILSRNTDCVVVTTRNKGINASIRKDVGIMLPGVKCVDM